MSIAPNTQSASNVLRLFSVYGPAGRPDMLPFLLAESAAGKKTVTIFEGDFERDWTYVDDVVAAMESAADRRFGFEVFNIGSGAPTKITEFLQRFEKVAEQKISWKYKSPPHTEMLVTFADNSKAKDMLGFSPTIELDDGIKKFWQWYQSRFLSDELSLSEKVSRR